MTRQRLVSVAIAAFMLIGSGAAAQVRDERPSLSLRAASRVVLPSETFQQPHLAIRTPTSHRADVDARAERSEISTIPHAQIKRGSRAGKVANVGIAAALGGLAGFFAGGFTSSAIRCGCSPEYFDYTVGAPIGAVVGGALTATYVSLRQRP